MKRREFVGKLGMASVGVAAAAALGGRVRPAAAGQHNHSTVDGPLASATVSFGQWKTDPPLDRFGGPTPPPTNQHLVIPYAPSAGAR